VVTVEAMLVVVAGVRVGSRCSLGGAGAVAGWKRHSWN
jgi:hypothetical protein